MSIGAEPGQYILQTHSKKSERPLWVRYGKSGQLAEVNVW